MRMRTPLGPRRNTTAPAARGAGFTPPFYRCSPPERALARGGGGGFGGSDGEARRIISVCARGRLEQFQERVLCARPDFDQASERKFPAFRGLDLREILRTHLRRQRIVGVLPEGSDKLVTLAVTLVTHGAFLSHCEPRTCERRTRGPRRRRRERVAPSLARAGAGLRARARTILLASDNGFSCRQYRARGTPAQTIKS